MAWLDLVRAHAFNVCVAAGLAVGVLIFDDLNRRRLSSPKDPNAADRAVLLVLAVCTGGVLGAVAISSLVEGRALLSLPWSFTFYGGVLGGTLAFVVGIPVLGLPFGRTADHLALGAAAGHGIGRIGCYVGGCCYGRTCEHPETWSWLPLFDGRIPVQLIESGCEFTNLAFLWLLMARASPRSGSVAAAWLMLYAAERFGLEFLRADPRGEMPIAAQWGLSPSQGIALGCGIIGASLLLATNLRDAGNTADGTHGKSNLEETRS